MTNDARFVRYKVSAPRKMLWTMTHANGSKSRVGHITTPHGNVGVYADDRWTHVTFVWRGYEYRLSEDRGHTPRGLVILAGRFVRDVMNGRVS